MFELLFGGIAGFVTEVTKGIFSERAEKRKIELQKIDNEQELKILERQLDIAKITAVERQEIASMQLQQAEIEADSKIAIAQLNSIDIATSSTDTWISRANGLIRPIITACIFSFASYIALETLNYLIITNVAVSEWGKNRVINDYMDMFKMIMSFWFVARSVRNNKK